MLLYRLARDPRVPVGSKALAIAGVGYVLSPIDLLPEILFGPIGFADDLLVVAAAASRIINNVHPDLVRAHWPGATDALEVVRRVTVVVGVAGRRRDDAPARLQTDLALEQLQALGRSGTRRAAAPSRRR